MTTERKRLVAEARMFAEARGDRRDTTIVNRLADALEAAERDKREAQEEAWDASRDAWGRWYHDLHRSDANHTVPLNPYRAVEIREGRQ